jgi:hypothetical protein
MKALFSEPVDLDVVEQSLSDDNFIYLVFLLTDLKSRWGAALAQTAELIDAFEREDRDWRKVYRLVSALIARAETFDDTSDFLSRIETTIGILPGTGMMEELRMAHLHKIDPAAWQRERNIKWLENYRAQLELLRTPA